MNRYRYIASSIAIIAILFFMPACSEKEQSKPDGSTSIDTLVMKDLAALLDKAKGDIADTGLAADQEKPSCGPNIYPCEPYGRKTGDVARNMEFIGFSDPQDHCREQKGKVLDFSKKVKLSFQDWYLGDPKPECAKYKTELLWVIVSAGWCGPCIEEVSQAAEEYANGEFNPKLGILNILFETDEGKPATDVFIKDWAEAYGVTFPVAMDPDFRMGEYFEKSGVPFNMLIDAKTMKIFYQQEGEDPQAVGNKISEFLDK
jgi:hypothetical protein